MGMPVVEMLQDADLKARIVPVTITSGGSARRDGRVPVDSLIDYLEAGDTLDEFLDNFPSVTRAAAIAALEEAKMLLTRA